MLHTTQTVYFKLFRSLTLIKTPEFSGFVMFWMVSFLLDKCLLHLETGRVGNVTGKKVDLDSDGAEMGRDEKSTE